MITLRVLEQSPAVTTSHYHTYVVVIVLFDINQT